MDKLKKITPVFLFIFMMLAITMFINISCEGTNPLLLFLILSGIAFALYPVANVSLSYFAIRIAKGEEANFKDMFYFYKVRVKDVFILSLVMVFFNSIVDFLEIVITNEALAFILLFLSFAYSVITCLRWVLIHFAFVEGLESDPIKLIKLSWNLTSGRCLEIIKIYLFTGAIATVIAVIIYAIGIAVYIALPLDDSLIVIRTGLVAGTVFVGSLSVLTELRFADFALRVFREEGLLEADAIKNEIF